MSRDIEIEKARAVLSVWKDEGTPLGNSIRVVVWELDKARAENAALSQQVAGMVKAFHEQNGILYVCVKCATGKPVIPTALISPCDGNVHSDNCPNCSPAKE